MKPLPGQPSHDFGFPNNHPPAAFRDLLLRVRRMTLGLPNSRGHFLCSSRNSPADLCSSPRAPWLAVVDREVTSISTFMKPPTFFKKCIICTAEINRTLEINYTSIKKKCIITNSLPPSLSYHFKLKEGTSLVAQWLRIHLPMQADMGSSPGPGRSHMPWSN